MLKPNINRQPVMSKEMLMERIKFLANDGRQNIQESASNSRATLMHTAQGADGLTYGILQENGHFFLKKTTKALKEATASDFEYIGGVQNLLAERFSSASDAHRRLNAKLYSLRESVGAAPDQEDDLLNKLSQKDQEDEANPEGGLPDAGAEAPVDGEALPDLGDGGEADGGLPDAGGEAAADGGLPDAGAEAPGDEAALDDLGLEDLSTEEAPVDGEEAPVDGEEAPEEGGSADPTSDAQKTLGKLGQQLDSIGELSPEFAKSVLNTTITKTQRAIEKMSDEDKDTLTQRIMKNGKKIEEDAEADFGNDWELEENWESDAARDNEMSRYQDQMAKNGNREEMPSYGDFMHDNGFQETDEDILSGLAAFSQKLKELEEGPTRQDIEAIAKEMNPMIWSKIHDAGVDNGIIDALVDMGMTNDSGEWIGNSSQSAPLHEGWNAIADLARLLVKNEINKNK